MKKTQLLLLFFVLALLNNGARAQYRSNGLSVHYNLLNSANLLIGGAHVQTLSTEFLFLDHFKLDAIYGAGNRTFNARSNFRTEIKSKFFGYGFSFVVNRMSIGMGLRHFWATSNGQFTFVNSHSDPVYLNSKDDINTTTVEIKAGYLINKNRFYFDPFIGIRLVTNYKSDLPFNIVEIPGLTSVYGPDSNPFIGFNIGYQLFNMSKKAGN